MFTGNTGDNTVHMEELQYPIVARYVRINPQRWNRFISMRVELYGCRFGKSSVNNEFSRTCNHRASGKVYGRDA